MKHSKLIVTLTALLLCAAMVFSLTSTAFAKKEIDWEAWEKKAEKLLRNEGHSLNGIVRVECSVIRPEGKDEYVIAFYKTYEGTKAQYRLIFSPKGTLLILETNNPGAGASIINNPNPDTVDKKLFEKGKKAVKDFLKRNLPTKVKLANNLVVDQILTKGNETYLTLTNKRAGVVFRVRVVPSARIEHYWP